MPTYEYICDSCGNDFEVVKKFSDAPEKSCPKCGMPVRQVFSANFGINFTGSGFYTTDTAKQKSNDTVQATSSCSQQGHKSCCACHAHNE
ncbi:FmdB family zinc ribbon protein [Treponema phagedenis]|uniref:FmdB family transcriptional regulator n=1 Tax=Treponema phagedenis TaxID=162 RepID=A0AAE6ITQ9_TREPH|nr:FmdB family zinc ribbon protein [Treponema phagedenis]EFW39431.1 putative regulatory protein (CxxC_CxxC_SSSS) [Treponema phagedenis F0421]QEJ98120.1 FmdB family transcriptional regulator [Treponema phagedenis]QEK03628.1 FmdB family transcriptional regulator [Treponema phagedenis]QEK09246.1 FmdB family transcriptional regulator [Treponema phagedenis]TYT76368.1 FmdB family transcriptional regulator [Treponema phagedenis]